MHGEGPVPGQATRHRSCAAPCCWSRGSTPLLLSQTCCSHEALMSQSLGTADHCLINCNFPEPAAKPQLCPGLEGFLGC